MIALRLVEDVPADTRTLVKDVATDPVSVDPFKPNETPLELLKVMSLRLIEDVPALTLSEP